MFESARGHKPNAAELKALRQVWLDNEVLYREGLALGLDKGDTTIRERVIFKALSMVDSNTKRPEFDDKVVREWFEKNRSRYDIPQRFNFQEAVIAGETSEATVRSFVSALNSGTTPEVQAGLRVFKDRPHDNIVQSYGEEFATALESSPAGEWRALQTKSGWRAMRLESIVADSKPPISSSCAAWSLQDWTDAVMSEQRSAAVAALGEEVHHRDRWSEAVMRQAVICVLLALLALVSSAVSAHELSMAEMEVRETSPGEFLWQWAASSDKAPAVVLAPVWPETCAVGHEHAPLRRERLVRHAPRRWRRRGLLPAAIVKIHWLDGQDRRVHDHHPPAGSASVRFGRGPSAAWARSRGPIVTLGRRAHPQRLRSS